VRKRKSLGVRKKNTETCKDCEKRSHNTKGETRRNRNGKRSRKFREKVGRYGEKGGELRVGIHKKTRKSDDIKRLKKFWGKEALFKGFQLKEEKDPYRGRGSTNYTRGFEEEGFNQKKENSERISICEKTERRVHSTIRAMIETRKKSKKIRRTQRHEK